MRAPIIHRALYVRNMYTTCKGFDDNYLKRVTAQKSAKHSESVCFCRLATGSLRKDGSDFIIEAVFQRHRDWHKKNSTNVELTRHGRLIYSFQVNTGRPIHVVKIIVGWSLAAGFVAGKKLIFERQPNTKFPDFLQAKSCNLLATTPTLRRPPGKEFRPSSRMSQHDVTLNRNKFTRCLPVVAH